MRQIRGSFFAEQLWWLLLSYIYVLVSEKNFLKKKVGREMVFDLISYLMSLQPSQLHLSFLQNMLNFIIMTTN